MMMLAHTRLDEVELAASCSDLRGFPSDGICRQNPSG